MTDSLERETGVKAGRAEHSKGVSWLFVTVTKTPNVNNFQEERLLWLMTSDGSAHHGEEGSSVPPSRALPIMVGQKSRRRKHQ